MLQMLQMKMFNVKWFLLCDDQNFYFLDWASLAS